MDESALRTDMIEGLEHQLGEPLGASVLSALQTVPREAFVDDAPYANDASEEAGTRALAPATVARMLTALDAEEGDDVLVVGAGIGYTSAALAEIVGARHVHAIDIDRRAVHLARSNLADAGYGAVLVDRRDGARGLPEYAPYDRVLVEAAVVTPPRALRDQLDDDGRVVYPRGAGDQTIVAVEPVDEDPVDRDDEGPARNGRSTSDDPAPDGFRTVEEAGPARLRPMLVDGEQAGVERNRTRREDAEFAEQGYFARTGWEQEWIDWDERI
ncbi:protein-L-isoaspartate(D-aspartate) O-methyltransferase [Halorubrum aquaticum]|uniref:protein-L-isoaspartate(D-aspartate) O-methyltransferase n=1 Tax=Halorubrum aquaticum TaxID=387340 RepID=A0A1I3CEE6_9EURY|nr:protein-L-isoaspartate O-methyltransferase [Halorubrum aquaticum]SFH72441.1 protein-L-isoaspartate(D-aspartate) O-methyltransferase [Halorubrum aquaticum]